MPKFENAVWYLLATLCFADCLAAAEPVRLLAKSARFRCRLARHEAVAADAIKTRVVEIAEYREAEIAKPQGEQAFLGSEPYLSVLVELSGPRVGHATHYGKAAVRQVALDDGTPLKVSRKEYDDVTTELIEIDRDRWVQETRDDDKDSNGFIHFTQPDTLKNSVLLELRFALPPRSARAIKVLDGNVTLLVGQTAEVRVPIDGKLNKLQREILSKAGLTVSVETIARGGDREGTPQVNVNITGDGQRVLEVCPIDSQGKPLETHGSASFGALDKSFDMKHKLPRDGQVRLQVVTQQTPLEVPFKFSEIKLP